ncbi:DUF3303 family protein [Streptomyces sp. NPDC059874]|uniref:DUF3303 family protein n=1 Tax=Streptomyces sp. NPDC059874 TaxID=3346983 RepID=UPI0036577D27
MRVMLRAHFDTAATNEGIATGALPQAVKKMMDTVKPESAYFGLHEGVRSCWIVFDLQDSTMMPSLTWELFRDYHAEIEVAPVMRPEELAKAMAGLQSS